MYSIASNYRGDNLIDLHASTPMDHTALNRLTAQRNATNLPIGL